MIRLIAAPIVAGFGMMAAGAATDAIDPNVAPWYASLLVKIVSDLGILTVLAWYLYYSTSKAQPRVEEIHRLELSTVTEAHVKAIETMVKDFHTAQSEQRASAEKMSSDFHTAQSEQRVAARADVVSLVDQMRDQNATVLEMVKNCGFKVALNKS